jgi:hypothetical protein
MNRKLDAYDNGESPHDALRHDDPLGNELHGASQPPMDDVDWMALHARIRRAAEPALAARAQALAETARPLAGIAASSNVWQPLAGWSPFGIPLAAAATVILMIGYGIVPYHRGGVCHRTRGQRSAPGCRHRQRRHARRGAVL